MTNIVFLPTTCPWLYLTCFWTSCGLVIWSGCVPHPSLHGCELFLFSRPSDRHFSAAEVPVWQTDPSETLEVWPETGAGAFSPQPASLLSHSLWFASLSSVLLVTAVPSCLFDSLQLMSFNCKDATASFKHMLMHKGDNLNFFLMFFFWSKVQKNVAPSLRLIYGFDHVYSKVKKEEEKLMNDVSLDWTQINHVVSFIHVWTTPVLFGGTATGWAAPYSLTLSGLRATCGQVEEMISVWPFCSLTNSSVPPSDVLQVTLWWIESKWAGSV